MKANLNESGLKPLGRAILIRAYNPERKTSVIAMPDTVEANSDMLETRAIVVECGATAWADEKDAQGNVQPRAQPGDKVFVTKYAGFVAIGPLDGKRYRLVNDRDIFCAITAEREAPQMESVLREVANG